MLSRFYWYDDLSQIILEFIDDNDLEYVDIVTFLMYLISTFISETADEEDIREFSRIFHELMVRSNKIKSKI